MPQMKTLQAKQRTLGLLFVLSFLAFGCLSEQAEKDIAAVFDGPGNADPTAPVTPAPSCFNDRFVQPTAQITNKVDLFFAVDTSGSLNAERTDIVNGIDAFIQALPTNVDANVAVVLGHSHLSQYSGVLYNSGAQGEPTVLKSSELSTLELREWLRHKLQPTQFQGPPGEGATDGGEAVLVAIDNLLKPAAVATAQTQGFFRTDAALAVVTISDENDICHYDHPNRVPDGQFWNGMELELWSASEFCTNLDSNGALYTIDADHVMQQLIALKGTMPLMVNTIAYTDPATVPAGGENEVGYGHVDIADLSNGVKVNLANGNYVAGLSNIGTLTTFILNLIYDFTLSQPAATIDPATITVTVDGVAATYEYLPTINQVHIPDPGTSESTVDINYCLGNPTNPGGGNPPGGCTGLGCGFEV